MRVKPRSIVMLLCMVVTSVLSVVFSNSAQAASDYDGVIQNAIELRMQYYSSGNYLYDESVSTSYMSILQACNSTAYTDLVATTSEDGGHWAVVYSPYYSGGAANSNIWIGWTHGDKTLYDVVWRQEPWAPYRYEAYAPVQKSIQMYITSVSGGVPTYDCGNYNSTSLGNGTSVTLGLSTSNLQVWVSNYPISSPDGEDYEGEYPQAEAPSPPTTTYNGSVDCGNDSLEYMLITQGDTNPVTLSYQSIYTATWSYDLTSDPYLITVGCGDSLAASYGSVSPVTSSNDWICNTIDEPHYCVLS